MINPETATFKQWQEAHDRAMEEEAPAAAQLKEITKMIGDCVMGLSIPSEVIDDIRTLLAEV